MLTWNDEVEPEWPDGMGEKILTWRQAQEIVLRYSGGSRGGTEGCERYQLMEKSYLPEMEKRMRQANLYKIEPIRALDIGPGWGTMMVMLASYGFHTAVLDLPGREGRWLTMKLATKCGVRWFEYNILEPGLHGIIEPKFHMITMSSVIGHLKWHPITAFENIWGMLEPGGTFILHTYDGDNPQGKKSKTPTFMEMDEIPEWKPEAPPWAREKVTHRYSATDILTLLGRLPFDGIEVKATDKQIYATGKKSNMGMELDNASE